MPAGAPAAAKKSLTRDIGEFGKAISSGAAGLWTSASQGVTDRLRAVGKFAAAPASEDERAGLLVLEQKKHPQPGRIGAYRYLFSSYLGSDKSRERMAEPMGEVWVSDDKAAMKYLNRLQAKHENLSGEQLEAPERPQIDKRKSSILDFAESSDSGLNHWWEPSIWISILALILAAWSAVLKAVIFFSFAAGSIEWAMKVDPLPEGTPEPWLCLILPLCREVAGATYGPDYKGPDYVGPDQAARPLTGKAGAIVFSLGPYTWVLHYCTTINMILFYLFMIGVIVPLFRPLYLRYGLEFAEKCREGRVAFMQRGPYHICRTVPDKEIQTYSLVRMHTYTVAVTRKTVQYFLWDYWMPHHRYISDREFCKRFTNTVLVGLIQPTEADPDIYVFDCMFFDDVEVLEDLKDYYLLVGCKVFFKRREQTLKVLRITTKDGEFLPGCSNWKYVKMCALGSASQALLYGSHPMVHFPMNVINAHLKQMPQGHALRQLLAPHMEFGMPVDELVIFGSMSPARPDEHMLPLYDCTVYDFDGVCKIMSDIAEWKGGIDFRSPWKPRCDSQWYWAVVQNLLYDEVRLFVDEFAERVFKDMAVDAHALLFARAVAERLPGFPGGEEFVTNRDTFVDTLASIIMNVSIEHSMEHLSAFTCCAPQEAPFMLHERPLPGGKNPTKPTSPAEMRRNLMYWELFTKWNRHPIYQSSLVYAQYSFAQEGMQAEVWEFRKRLRTTWDNHRKALKLPEVEHVAKSIEW